MSKTGIPAIGGGATNNTSAVSSPKPGGFSSAPLFVGSNFVSLTLTSQAINATLLVVENTGTLKQIGLKVEGGQASSVIRLGIYGNSAGAYPGQLIGDFGTVDGSGSFVVPSITLATPLVLPAGLYWLVCVSQGSPASQPSVDRINGTGLPQLAADSLISAANNAFIGGWRTGTGVCAGALPATFPVGATKLSATSSGDGPVVFGLGWQ